MKKSILAVALLTCMSGTAVAASSTNKGATPKGKPFVQVNNQIVHLQGVTSDLQTQLNNVVEDIDNINLDLTTLEGRVAANEIAITDLQAETSMLEGLIAQTNNDVEAMQLLIAQLQDENAELLVAMAAGDSSLQAQIDSNKAKILALQFAVSDVGPLQAQIDALTAEIATLEAAMAAGEANAQMQIDDLNAAITRLEADIAALNSLSNQVDENQMLIAALQAQIDQLNADLQLKSDYLNATCPSGSSLLEVYGDGSFACEVNSGGVTGFSQVRVRIATTVPAGETRAVRATCPSGYMLTGGGFNMGHNNVYRSHPDQYLESVNDDSIFNRTWQVVGTNELSYESIVSSVAVCLKAL